MGNLSEHFSTSEFACRCGCGFMSISQELIAVLESARCAFDAPVTINCGCRCSAHNKAVGGVPNSQHLQGIAADIVIAGSTPSAVYRWFDEHYPETLGLGSYKTFTHVDVRSQRARWKG
ncbi:D-Ala-D-Ala carboxypeptidase family metallohydrolase [Lelliottia sp. V106_10]|uniref:D-Ala-D-Ala carboxypeptidase family metallohydrolase n=1 Tax=Lelliottia wanjuensis TaxID=3050585 RepID=A0AAP4D0N4_9ENTR|nr:MULTISPECIES: D-Ala-D-Ala carboxypeptidase family metallohydrolase [unclassified Lelliottia]MDK9357637.1 D-Ala-D-Ala carboxypeptidase family metallohydrolase [Lelliottia sp. V106_16]MDK9361808.1 D-Ala-D-Ala carboxypeptidase family metallohydrolase [Lelliottia sp. V106_12]MDK9372871.1 D-Ala-D-Ala carboxypeptidase family metallohydrolase [Lelliottia sp. V106_10]MDK9599675.1 D-Ala-D-Ala carboxypeptidase family metallohydrolase [Lelliottia sp. V106_5]MDK9618581.1 D-Ala-D-Ala carboxypeptidase fa